jgi:hypothetical protein
VSFDFTFGTMEWSGRRRGKRKDRRDGLAVFRRLKRGYDADDALKLFRQFMARMAPWVTWIAAAEPNPNRSGLNPGFHGHAMLAALNLRSELDRKKFHDRYVEENGWCKVNLIRSAGACAEYCTKHLVRRALILDWHFGSHQLWQQNRKNFHPEAVRSRCVDTMNTPGLEMAGGVFQDERSKLVPAPVIL